MPIFDGHISYVGVDSVEEAEYLISKLKDKKVEKVVNKLFDARSIGTRLTLNIPKYKPKGGEYEWRWRYPWEVL